VSDDPKELRRRSAQRRQRAEERQASADALRRKGEILQASADADNRAALDLEDKARAAEQRHLSAVRRKWGGMVIVSAPSLGPETVEDALRSADVDNVERQALEVGVERTKQQQREQFTEGRKKVGDATQAKVVEAWGEEYERLRAQHGARVPKKTVESVVAERVGVSPRTVQRCLKRATKFRHKI
jgi:predicted DNA-binding protein (UPF0251 family)